MSEPTKPIINLSEADQAKLTANWITLRVQMSALLSDAQRVLNTSRPASKTSGQALVTKKSLLDLERRVNHGREILDKQL